MAPAKLKIALAGLGRIGKKHAINLLNFTPEAEFVAAFSPAQLELEWAKETLAPYGVALYDDYNQMMSHEGLQAVVIATAATVHAEEIISAIQNDLHVMCEKPLSTSIESCQTIIEAAQKKPWLKVMCGFSRRFDASYREAWKKMDSGVIGEPKIFRSQTCDKYNPEGFFVAYSAMSGGIFVDMAIHDVDLSLWFFGEELTFPKTVSAFGVAALHPELLETNDRDNAVGIVEYYGGKIAYFFCSRMMAHGQEDSTDIIGTEGKLSVNASPQKDLVNLCHAGGITREIQGDFWERFEGAFAREIIEFTSACLLDKPLPLKLGTALKAGVIAMALQEAMVTGKSIHFTERGIRQEQAFGFEQKCKI